MLQGLGGPHLVIILFIVVLLFGAPKLPALAKSLGQSMRILKREVSHEEAPETAVDAGSTAERSGDSGAGVKE